MPSIGHSASTEQQRERCDEAGPQDFAASDLGPANPEQIEKPGG
jgi:hypothetical protein